MSCHSGVKAKMLLPHSPQKLRVRGVPESVAESLYVLRCEAPWVIVKPWGFSRLGSVIKVTYLCDGWESGVGGFEKWKFKARVISSHLVGLYLG